MSTTLAMANKIVLSDVVLQEKDVYNPGLVEPDPGITGLASVNVFGGGVLSAEHSYANNTHTFTLGEEAGELKAYTSKIVIEVISFNADFNVEDKIVIKDSKGNTLTCIAYSREGEKEIKGAREGIFKTKEAGLIEVTVKEGEENKAIISGK